MKKFLLLLVFLSVGQSATSQDSPKVLTLKECIDIALTNNLRVRRGVFNVRTAEINLLQSKMAFAPSINVGSTGAKNFGRALNPVTNSFISRNSTTMNLFGQASMPLFTGLRNLNNVYQSNYDLSATNDDLQKAKNDVSITVVNAYTTVVFNKELLSNSRFQLQSSQEQLERIRKQVAAGSLPKSNELNQDAQVATNEVNLINQENALNLSMLQLKQSMQMPGSNNIDVEIPALNPEDLILDQTPEQIFGISVQTMPEIRSAENRVNSANYALRAAKAGFFPRLTLNGSLQSNYSDISQIITRTPDGTFTQIPIGQTINTNEQVVSDQPNFITTTSDYKLGNQIKDNLFKGLSLSLNIPVFNNFNTRSAVQRAAVTKEVASITKQETENTLRQSIETAYNDALAASKTYGASLRQVNAREEAYRMTKQRFEIGAANYVEFRISENDLFQSKSDLARAKYNFIFRKKLLDFYQGKPIEY